MERVGNQLEGNSAIGQRRRLVDDLLALRVLDPELAVIRADAIDRAFKELCPLAVAGFVHRKLDGRRTAIQNQNRQRRHEKNLLI